MAGQFIEQVVFGAGQVDVLTGFRHSAAGEIDLQVAASRSAVRSFAYFVAGSFEQSANARQQFLGTEWLGDVIISPGVEAVQNVGFRRFSREHDDGNIGEVAHAPGHFETINIIGQYEVQQH